MSNLNLPTRQSKKWNTNNPRLKTDPNKKPVNMWFCPVIDPETNKRCGRILDHWSSFFFETYGMCEHCFKKYNPNLDEVKEIEQELDKEEDEKFNNDNSVAVAN